MTLKELQDSLKLWTRREAERKKLHTVAQQDLLEARAGGVTGPELKRLTDRRDLRSEQLKEARDRIAERLKQIDEKRGQKVKRPAEKFKRSVSNQSSRNGVKPKLIVLHSTESHNRAGTGDLESIASWFNNPAAGASSHVVNDNEGFSAQLVPDSNKAWTQAFYNPQSLSIEQIGFASQGKSDWTDAQLRSTAKYIAYWSKKYGIPITSSTTHGVTLHSRLGAAGGGHHDPGNNYPFERVLELARGYAKNGW